MVLGYTLGPVSHTLLNERLSACKNRNDIKPEGERLIYEHETWTTYVWINSVKENDNKKLVHSKILFVLMKEDAVCA